MAKSVGVSHCSVRRSCSANLSPLPPNLATSMHDEAMIVKAGNSEMVLTKWVGCGPDIFAMPV